MEDGRDTGMILGYIILVLGFRAEAFKATSTSCFGYLG